MRFLLWTMITSRLPTFNVNGQLIPDTGGFGPTLIAIHDSDIYLDNGSPIADIVPLGIICPCDHVPEADPAG